MGMKRVMRQSLEAVLEGTDGVVVSLDMDVLDPLEAPGVGTPVREGSLTGKPTWLWSLLPRRRLCWPWKWLKLIRL